MIKRVFASICCVVVLFSFFVQQVKAQDMSLGTAISIALVDKKSNDGDIVVTTKTGYKLAADSYDDRIFGVISKNPALYLEDRGLENSVPVIVSGKAFVRVSTMSGPIQAGDFISTSTVLGVGQKAVKNGYIVGVAEENYDEKDPKKIGKILVTLNPHFVQFTDNITGNFLETIRTAILAARAMPLGAFRYTISALIALVCFYFGFRFFGYASRNGVEAIGRNPLASKAILIGVVLNVTLTIAIMFLGIVMAYIILVI